MSTPEEKYNQLMSNLTVTNNTQVQQQNTPQYNSNYQQNHQAETQLVGWLQQYQTSNGIIGKRSTIERDEPAQDKAPAPLQRRRVVVPLRNRNRKLIDE